MRERGRRHDERPNERERWAGIHGDGEVEVQPLRGERWGEGRGRERGEGKGQGERRGQGAGREGREQDNLDGRHLDGGALDFSWLAGQSRVSEKSSQRWNVQVRPYRFHRCLHFSEQAGGLSTGEKVSSTQCLR